MLGANGLCGFVGTISLACARVDCVQYSTQTSTQSGFIDKPICSQTTRARTREGLTPLRNPKAYFDAWRSATVGDSTDYLRIAVNEAVEAFSSDKSAEAQESDRRIWLKIANRIGLERFLDAFDQKSAEIRELAARGKRLASPSKSFQKLLNKRFPKGGAKENKKLQLRIVKTGECR